MAHESEVYGRPFIAASVINFGAGVAFASGAAEKVHPASALHTQPLVGIAVATAASPGVPVAIQDAGVAKAIAAASIAAGKPVTVGSINGALIEFTPSSFNTASQFTAAPQHALGYAMDNAGAGDVFSVLVRPFVSL